MTAKKDLYDLGEVPPLGHVPRRMHAATIRPERYGEPQHAYDVEVIDVPPIGPHQVLVQVMAAGVNYNGVWTAFAKPVDMIAMRKKRGEKEEFHVGGSEGAGVVWAVGSEVRKFKVGDAVMISPVRWDEHADDVRMGVDPVASTTARVWGYEDNFGAFAQFSVVEDFQCFHKPKNLSFETASCVIVSFATAYRQLRGWHPHVVRPGDPVLIWGGAGGLGTAAIQITREFGGLPIAVVSSAEKAEYCKRLGAHGVINRRDFDHWGRLPEINTPAFERWLTGARSFGKAFWDALGERRNPYIVFEHSGQDTLPTSIFVCDNRGMVVTCGGTSGYNCDVDARVLWMRQKRFQGSHFASTREISEAIHMLAGGRLDPCHARTYPFHEVGEAHQLMYENQHPPGNMALLVNAPREGMKELEI
jgi:crotonyl-CoA carboxylase/reductase